VAGLPLTTLYQSAEFPSTGIYPTLELALNSLLGTASLHPSISINFSRKISETFITLKIWITKF